LAKRPVVFHAQHLVGCRRRKLPRAGRQVDRGADVLPTEAGVECRTEGEPHFRLYRFDLDPAIEREGVACDRLDAPSRLVGAAEVNLVGDDFPMDEAKQRAVLRNPQVGGVGGVEDFIEHHVV